MNKSIPLVVIAQPYYASEQSEPYNHKYVWSYQITIMNKGTEIVQLLNRFWRITDMVGKVEEIYGAGVVGLQPIIKPGKQFTYTSYCLLMTPQGHMEGHYELQNLEEEFFSVQIPKMILNTPITIKKTFRSRLH